MNKSAVKSLAKSIRAIASKVEALTFEDAPTFAPSPAVKLLRDNGMKEQANMIETTERAAFDKEFGDADKVAKRNAKLVKTTLEDCFRALLLEHGLSVTRAARDIVTASNITKEQTTHALAERRKGAQLSTLAESIGSDYVNLRLAIIRDHGDDALKTNAEPATV